MGRLTKRISPISWSGAPALTFQQGVADQFDLGNYLRNTQNKTVTYAVVGSLPSGVSLVDRFVNYDGAGAAGSSSVVFTATIPGWIVSSPSATCRIEATTNPVNTPPYWDASTPSGFAISPTASVGTIVADFANYARDDEGDEITYTITGLPSFLQAQGSRVVVSSSVPTTTDSYSVSVSLTEAGAAIGTVTAEAISYSSVSLSWAAVTGATEYNIERSTNQVTWTAIPSVTSTQAFDYGLTASTPYYYRVRAVVGGTAGSWSNIASVTTPAQPVVIPGTLPTLTLSGGGAGKAWTVGHAFKKGDVPSTDYITATGADAFQAHVRTRWSDGSVKFAVLAGVGGTSVQLGRTTSAPSGSAITTSALSSHTVAVGVGAETITFSGADWTSPKRTTFSGPVASSWLYRKPVPGSNHLVVWLEVIAYSTGNVELVPWVENCYTLVASPTNTGDLVFTVTVNGASKFSQTLDIKHHTRVCLLSGAVYAYWTGTDPEIIPQHSVTYLMSTGLTPTYVQGASETIYARTGRGSYTSNFVPNVLGDIYGGYMPSMGGGTPMSMMPEWDAVYMASGGDPRAWQYSVQNGYAAGAWHIHYRNEATNDISTFAEFPSLWLQGTGVPPLPTTSGEVNWDRWNVFKATPDVSHQPAFAYLPYLLTGRWWFMDEVLSWDFYNYLMCNYVLRGRQLGIFDDTLEVRGRGFGLRTRAMALSIVPGDHPSYASLKASWEANVQRYYEKFVTGTHAGGVWANTVGHLGLDGAKYPPDSQDVYVTDPNDRYWWHAPWQTAYQVCALGLAWDLEVPQSAQAKIYHEAVRNHGYTLFVTKGGAEGSAFNYRRFSTYRLPFVQPWNGSTPTNYISDFSEMYRLFEAWGNDITAAPRAQALSALPSGTTLYHYNAEITSDQWANSTAVFANLAPITWAVNHGYPNAQAAWDRITGSSTYSTRATTGYSTNPTWALRPR